MSHITHMSCLLDGWNCQNSSIFSFKMMNVYVIGCASVFSSTIYFLKDVISFIISNMIDRLIGVKSCRITHQMINSTKVSRFWAHMSYAASYTLVDIWYEFEYDLRNMMLYVCNQMSIYALDMCATCHADPWLAT